MPVNYKKYDENRRNRRFNLSSPWRTVIHIGEKNLEAGLVDLSKSGVKIRFSLSRPSMSEAIQQGFEINLTIFLIVFLLSGKEYRFNATIKWVQRVSDAYIMGLHVIDLVGKTLINGMADEWLAPLEKRKKEQSERLHNAL